MVLYFSATGNTAYIAKQIADKIGDGSLDLLKRIKDKDFSPVKSETPFIICSPVYVCEIPRFFADYLRNVELTGNRYVYFVFTSGGYTGIAGYIAARIIRKKNMIYMGWAEFKMPRNYPISSRYRMLSDEENIERIRSSCERIPAVADRILKGEKLKARYITLFEKIVTLPFNPVWVKYRNTADLFRSTEKCVGCGKCVRLCPLNNIILKDKRPVWDGSCAHCMACMANCPAEAIEYGNITPGRKKYRIGKYITDK